MRKTALGEVDFKLLPIEDLQKVVDVARKTYWLEPFFEEADIAYYYLLIESLLPPRSILLSVHMKFKTAFNIWEVKPFPMRLGKEIMLNLNYDFIIISEA